jgi:hypothetical protein
MQGRGRRFDGLRLCGALLAGCWAVASATPSAALNWQWGEVTGRLDSFASAGFSIRTQAPNCRRIPNLTGELGAVGMMGLTVWEFPAPANNPGGCIDPSDITTNATLLNADDGNLNWDQWDVFSVAFKGSHDLELRWRNIGAFTRVSYFIDAIGADAATPGRTHLAEDSRWRTSVIEGGVVGGQFLLLDAYAFAGFEWAGRYFDFRVGNQVVNWGESTYTQGGINATNTIDVTKIRLPGSDIREALFPAPIVKVGGNIVGSLSFEAYYQFVWRQMDLDPPGTFFSTSDVTGRGAQAYFSAMWGDPGSTGMTAQEIFDVRPGDYVDDAWILLFNTLFGLEREDLDWAFFVSAPYGGAVEPSDQGQFGVALRYYFDSIETEVGLYYVRLHAKTPSVGFRATEITAGPGRIRYFQEYPEDIDLWGLSFNTVISGMSLAGEVSVRRNEPVPITSAQPDLIYWDLLPEWAGGPEGPGGSYSGFVREMRLVGIVNGVYVVGPGTPVLGRALEFIGAQDMNLLAEMGVQWFPDLSDTCPPSPTEIPFSPEERKALNCISYAKPLGIDEVDKLQVSYTIRADASYDRVFGTPVTLRPVVSFRHDAYGVGPGNGSLWTNGVMQIGVSLVADYQQRWKGVVSYSNTFGGSQSNPNIDRDFISVSIEYTY